MAHGNLKQMSKRTLKLAAAGVLLLCQPVTGYAKAEIVPDDQRAWIEIRGAGVAPSSKIALITGGKNSIVVESDKNGQFAFEKLGYYSFVPLTFRLDIPEYKSELVTVGKTSLTFDLDPYGATVVMSGKISPAGSVVMNVDGIQAESQIAGLDGGVHFETRTPLGLADGNATLTTSIINVGESCCPKILVPAPPIQLSVSSVAIPHQAVPSTTPAPVPAADTSRPIQKSPVIRDAPQKSVIPSDKNRPYYIVPSQPGSQETPPKNEQPKKKIPYLVTGAVEQEFRIEDQNLDMAVSFPAAKYESTYVGGFKKLSDYMRNAFTTHALMIGAFIDGRAQMSAQGTLQKLNARAIKDYTVSDQVCKFGTLSRGVAGTESLVDANKKAFSKMILDRNAQSQATLYAEATQGMVDSMNDFKIKYCEGADENSALSAYCASAKTPADKYFNRDVDYTRGFDVPLTLDVNYTDNTLTDDEEKTLSLFQMLALQDPQFDASGNAFGKQEKTDDFQDLHQSLAIRQLVGNTFSNMVAMKAKGTASSGAYMKNTLVKMGLTAADAQKLIGDNPSYFAQMEILTKKLYQDPAFYANLYDTPANIARQRVAIKAIGLMQDRDFLESLKRREMLLSELLELKLRKKADEENLAGINAD